MSKKSVCEFLRRCIEYADSSMKRKEERGDDSEIIAEWKAYRNYTQYALEEIEKGDLDHWFERKSPTADMELDMEELDHFCLLYTSPSPRDRQKSRMPSSA